MKIKNTLIISLCLLFVLSLCGCGKYDKIRGLWQNKKDGIIMQFYPKDKDTKERKVTLGILDVEYEGTYTIDGKKLIIKFSEGKSITNEESEEAKIENLFAGQTITYFYEVEGKTLTLTNDNSKLKLQKIELKDD